MATETERKFLVDRDKWRPAGEGRQLIQAYLSVAPNPTVRLRVAGEKAFLTIKGRSETLSRPEFEYEIPVADALEMLQMAVTGTIEKVRYIEFYEGFRWEVDVFSGKNKGLVMAEIELEAEDQLFPCPDWILEEVSGDARFYNSYLAEHPFQEW